MQVASAKMACFFPADARTVFEICRPGESVAAEVRVRNPETAFAVLPLSSAASMSSLADVMVSLEVQCPQFDALLFQEAILVLPDPMAAVAALLPYLQPKGALLLTLPQDWCERQRITQGKASLIAALEAVLNDGPLQGSNLVVDCAVLVPVTTGTVSHLVVRAARRGSFNRFYIGAMTLRPAGGCNDTRVDLPNAFLETLPGVRTSAAVDHITGVQPLAGERQIAILQRRISGPADIPNLKGLLKQGYLLVAEFDDHPQYWPAMEQNQHLTFRGVHAVQTSTEFLSGELCRYNSEIAVFPNQIASMPAPKPLRTDGRIALFFGAFNRSKDWQPLVAPLNRILSANRGRVGVQVVHDRAFFDALETDTKAFLPTCGYDGYIQALRRCDIGLLPLEDTLFNRSKSDLKFIECAAHGVVALASPVVYGDTVRDGDTAVLFRSPEEFTDRLTRLIEEGDWRHGIAKRAYGYVRDHRLLAQHFRKRLDWYQSLLDRKEELDARLYERVPELRP